MRIDTQRSRVLALVGLAALAVYILACTAFSPDDRKVLYPAFVGTNGAVGLACYDRDSRRSEMIFVPVTLADGAGGAQPLRGQWLGDGSRILATWIVNGQDDVLNLASLPFGTRGPVRLFSLPGKQMANSIILPAPTVGDRAFFVIAPSEAVRVDLESGEVTRHELGAEAQEWLLYPSADGKGVFYLADAKSAQGRTFGRLDPATFALTPLITFTNDIKDGISFTYDLAGDRVAFVEGAEDQARLVVLERGKPPVLVPLRQAGGRLGIGNAVFTRDGGALIAAFERDREGSPGASFGLVEIPLRGGPPRETMLLRDVTFDSKGGDPLFYFQIGVSHDGKTAAVSSTYLACLISSFKAEDCALFFVDLSDPNRKVTKAPIPLPAHRAPPGK